MSEPTAINMTGTAHPGWPDDEVWEVLELVAVQQGLDANLGDRLQPLRRPDFDHGRLVELAMRHGLLAALADFLNRHRLRRDLPTRLRAPVMSYLRLSEHRALLLTAEARRIADGLAVAGITFAFTKGVVLQSVLYGQVGLRTFNDIDLMIAPEDRDRIRAAIIGLGYEPDTDFDPGSKNLKKISRAAERMYQLSPDHWPHFRRLTDDVSTPMISVDVANSMTWHKCQWEVPLLPVMEAITPVAIFGDVILPSLSPAHSFIFVCLHLFREGWIQRNIALKDVCLSQFVDIFRYWQRTSAEDHRLMRELIDRAGIAQPIAWACGHTDALFGSDIIGGLRLPGDVAPEWLNSAQGTNGQLLTWTGTMRSRLRSPTPPVLTASCNQPSPSP
jgi:hypothetical protein